MPTFPTCCLLTRLWVAVRAPATGERSRLVEMVQRVLGQHYKEALPPGQTSCTITTRLELHYAWIGHERDLYCTRSYLELKLYGIVRVANSRPVNLRACGAIWIVWVIRGSPPLFIFL